MWWWWRTVAWIAAAGAMLAGCSTTPKPPEPGRPQMGVASWYGPGFHGRATTSGEIYDQRALTAAHPSLPLGTRVHVTNLDNGRGVDVRVNDRGPFVKGRTIDLSYAAADRIGVVGPGTAPVRIDVVEHPPGDFTTVRYCVQVAAFSDVTKANTLRDILAAKYRDVYISPVRSGAELVHRVRVGPYAERGDAERRARELKGLGFPAAILEEPGQ